MDRHGSGRFAARPPFARSRSILVRSNDGGVYKALGGRVSVLLFLVFGGLFFRPAHKFIGMLMVPSGSDLTARVARAAVEGKISPHLEAVLPLSSVPEALRRTGLGEVKGKLVIRP